MQPPSGGNAGLELPAPTERPPLDGMKISKVKGVAPAYTKLPIPGVQSVQEKPGTGGTVSAFTITWGVPAKLEGNKWYEALNEALGTTLKPIVTPAQTFGDKLVTTIASGDIPDIVTNEPSYRGRAARKYLPQGVFHDLREFLGGDKVKKYPNLALVPDYAWQNSRINGALYGVPCYRNQTIDGTICFRTDWAERGGFDGKPTSADEIVDWLQAIKAGGGKGTYPLATMDQAFGFCSLQTHGVPNNWKLDNGSLIRDLETDEYEEALQFANKLWEAKLIHPDVLTLTPNPAEYQGYFLSGRVGICNGSIDAYFGRTGQFAEVRKRDPEAECDVLIPPGRNGGRGMINPDLGFYCMLSIPSSVTDEKRIDELLGVIDFLAAPLGSREYFLTHYGIEGHNYTVKDGVPVPSSDEKIAGEAFLNQLGAFNYGFFFPGAPEDEALTCQRYAEEMTECFVPDPTTGLDSESSYSKGDALAALEQDYVNAIVTGRRPLSDLAELRERWKANGGDDIRREFEQALTEQ